MKIVEPGFRISGKDIRDGSDKLSRIASAARVCYQASNDQGKSDSDLVKMIIKNQHFAMLEHGGTISVGFVCDRGISHELVRHREASFAQESTRYCNYSKGKFGNDVTVIKPIGIEPKTLLGDVWYDACSMGAEAYMDLLDKGVTPQMARSVLPNSTKTEIVVTANIREWRHILALRCAFDAHPQMRQLMLPLLEAFHTVFPILFDDLWDVYGVCALRHLMFEKNATDEQLIRTDTYMYDPTPEVYAKQRIDLLYDEYNKGVAFYGNRPST